MNAILYCHDAQAGDIHLNATVGAAAARRPPFLRADVRRLFESLREAGGEGCLAVVTHAEGSTYSKPGALMLFAADGRQAGLLSGGCLEGDLAERAARVVATGAPAAVCYDARDVEQDVLFGLAFGCEGLLRIHLLPCGGRHGFEPLASLARDAAAGVRSLWGLVVAGDGEGGVIPVESARAVAGTAAWNLPGGHAALVEPPGGSGQWLLMRMAPPPHLLVLGAGAEAPALAGGAAGLGWRVTVIDHRAAWADVRRFAAGVCRQVLDPRDDALDRLPTADAAVVMAHHLEVDAAWLARLAESAIPWVGLLGPAARRGRLLARLGAIAPGLAGRVQGPVGLPVGARTPEEIALSILAAAQQAVAAQD